MRRKLTLAGIGVPVLILIVLYFSQSIAFKHVIEKGGPQLTGTAVEVDRTLISILSGTGSASNLRIANPEGFSEGSAISLEEMDLKLKTLSLFSNTVVIEELTIENPEINYEVSLAGVNIRVLQRKITGDTSSKLRDIFLPKKEPEAATEDVPMSSREVQINKLVVRGGKISFRSNLLNAGGMSVAVPDFTVDNFTSGKGINTRQVSKLLLTTLIDTSFRALANSPEALDEGAGSILKAISDTLKDDANIQTEGGAKTATDFLRSLLQSPAQ